MDTTPIPPTGVIAIIKDAMLLLPSAPLLQGLLQGLLHTTCISDDADLELGHLTPTPPPTLTTTQDERWQEQRLVLLLQVLLRTRFTNNAKSPDLAQ